MKCYFIGSAGLLHKCVSMSKEYYKEDIEIHVYDVNNMKETKAELFAILEKETEPSFVFSINNPYIIPKSICEKKELTLVNLHHSLLPLHPGRNAEAWTIYEQDEYGGITWHMLTESVDSGNIICQRSVKIDESTTSIALLKKCEQLAIESFCDTIMPFEELHNKPMKRQKKKNKVNYASQKPNDGLYNLDWDVKKGLAFLNSMNYGVLNVIGKPRICCEGSYYQIVNYKYAEEESNYKEFYQYEENRKKYLEIRDNYGFLKLRIQEDDRV